MFGGNKLQLLFGLNNTNESNLTFELQIYI